MPTKPNSDKSPTQEREERELEELVKSIQEARKKASDALLDLSQFSETLRQKGRRASTELAAPMVTFATAHLRLASAMTQGLRRTSNMDRLIGRAKEEALQMAQMAEEREARETQRKAKQAQPQVARLSFPVDSDAISELYGDVNENG